MTAALPNERRIRISLEVNGTQHIIAVAPRISLVDALREVCGLPGTPNACGADCTGAATVLVDGEPVCACLMFAVQAHGMAVTTVEAPAGEVVLDAVRKGFAEAGATPCCGCTAGYVMHAAGALSRNPRLDDEAVDAILAGGVCRNGHYDRIGAAIRAARGLLRKVAA